MSLPKEYTNESIFYIKRTMKSIQYRFWKKVDVKSNDECWNWKGYIDLLGYGKLGTTQGRTGFAHRVSWELANDSLVPDGLVICHRCDNPSCVNPSHLFLGTVADNNQDRHNKGRTKSPSNKGENNPAAILTKVQVIEMRDHKEKGTLSPKEMSIKYGIALNTVYEVLRKRNWKDV